MQHLKIDLIGLLNANEAHRRSPCSFCDRRSIDDVILVRFYIDFTAPG